MSSKILVVRVDSFENYINYTEMRDDILEGIRLGVLILGKDDTLEVMELPPLGGVVVLPGALEDPPPKGEPPSDLNSPLASFGKAMVTTAEDLGVEPTESEEKRAILQRLKDYRAAHGLGSLEAVSVKTAHLATRRLTAEELRMFLVGDGPPRPIEDWRKISRALDKLEQEKIHN